MIKINAFVAFVAYLAILVCGNPIRPEELLFGEIFPDDISNGLPDGDPASIKDSDFDSVFDKKDHVPGKQKFTLTQVHNSKYQPLDGQSALLQAYAKYSTRLPPGMEEAMKMDPALDHKSKFFFPQGR